MDIKLSRKIVGVCNSSLDFRNPKGSISFYFTTEKLAKHCLRFDLSIDSSRCNQISDTEKQLVLNGLRKLFKDTFDSFLDEYQNQENEGLLPKREDLHINPSIVICCSIKVDHLYINSDKTNYYSNDLDKLLWEYIVKHKVGIIRHTLKHIDCIASYDIKLINRVR